MSMFVWNDSGNNNNNNSGDNDDRNDDNSRSISDCFKSFRLKFETCCSNYQWFILIRFLFAMSWQLQNANAWSWWTHWDACIRMRSSGREVQSLNTQLNCKCVCVCVYSDAFTRPSRMRNARNSLISFYISHNKPTLFASFNGTHSRVRCDSTCSHNYQRYISNNMRERSFPVGLISASVLYERETEPWVSSYRSHQFAAK